MESSDRFFLLALSLPTSHVAYISAFTLRCLGQPRKFIFILEREDKLPSPSGTPYGSVYACLEINPNSLICVCLLFLLSLPTACSKNSPHAGSSNAAEKQALLVKTHLMHKSAPSIYSIPKAEEGWAPPCLMLPLPWPEQS